MMPIMRHRLERGLRKVLRPLRRAIASRPSQEDVSSISGPVLVLLAHPDDEVFCSGLISELRERDIAVHLLLFTRGEGGERGHIASEVNLGAQREQEMVLASKQLDVTSLTFLDYQDPPAVGPELLAPEHDPATLCSDVAASISKNKAIHLITHGSSGEYWHPAHLVLHRCARQLAKQNPKLQLWTFNAWRRDHPLPAVLNQDDAAALTLHCTQSHERRLAALMCHRSQAAVFERFASGTISDFVTLTSIECYRKW